MRGHRQASPTSRGGGKNEETIVEGQELRWAVLALLLLAWGCQPVRDGVPQVQAPEPEVQAAAAPEAAPAAPPGPAPKARKPKPEAKKPPPPLPPFRPAAPARAVRHMISAANPLAAQAGLDMLRAGGAAVDAAIAAQMVLNLVEPQSSGIGGGGFLLHFAEQSGEIAAYDGRETAPGAAQPYMFMDGRGTPMKFADAATGGLSVGVPGLLRMLEAAHRDHGRLPWAKLFEAAIELAEKGFPVSQRLHDLIARAKDLKTFAGAAGTFYGPDGEPLATGDILVNRPLAETLRLIAEKGAVALYGGEVARDIVGTVRQASRNPGRMRVKDLAAYRAIKREPVCQPYRDWLVCGMGPPSSGGVTTLQILGILQNYDVAALSPGPGAVANVRAVHLVAEASRLAFADRNAYIADPDFTPVPVAGLLDPAYLERRAGAISADGSMGKAAPGRPGIETGLAPDASAGSLSTTHLSVIDSWGNALAMTTSIERAFGSQLMVRGFMLNNQLTDFSFRPNEGTTPVANRAAPGKRPRSSMSPTLVFDAQGRAVMALGSPGGSRIIGYVVKTLIAALDWGMDIQAAIELPHFVNRNGATDLEKGTHAEALEAGLQSLGHRVRIRPMTSGLHGIMTADGGLQGGSDPRREGVALGD